MNELLQASGYAALVYVLFNYLISFGSGRPLVEAINPNRRFLPFAALGLFGAAYSLLLRSTWRTGHTQLELLRQLVSEERAQSEVVGAMSFFVFGLSLLILWVYCHWMLPRDPKTFSPNPHHLLSEYRQALNHYVRWNGGLDYAFLCEVRDPAHGILAEGISEWDVRRGLERLPIVGSAVIAHDAKKAVEDQKLLWKKLACQLFELLPKFDELMIPARQGCNVALSFDVTHGAIYFEILERPENNNNIWLVLFGSSLNQHEVSTLTAGRHFSALSQAIRHIRSGVTKK